MKNISDCRALLAVIIFPLGLFSTFDTYANDKIWAKLAEGGKVVLMRHASVQEGRGYGNPLFRDPSCKKERNLSSAGEHEARIIGERFRERKIQVSEVRHSPFCRTADTAKIAFGSGNPAEYLNLLEVLGQEEASKQTGQLNRIIGSYVGAGNLVLITHEPNINAVSFEMIKQSDFLVLQPKGGDTFEELGVIRWSDTK